MPNETTIYTLYPEAEIDQHVRYFDGQFLGSQDFVDAQRYLIDRLRRGLDVLTVPGVARGLQVASPAAWTLTIAPGTAIDPHGRLLVLTAALDGVAVPQDYKGKAVDVALAYDEVPDRIQGGNSEEAGTRGATRVREAPAVRFYAAGLTPAADAVAIARVNVAGDGTCTFIDPDPVRRRAGIRLPSEEGVESPSIRDGGPARPRTLAVDGNLAVDGKLAVGTLDPEAAVDLRGLTKVDELHVREKSFRVEGEVARFYPIVFEDLGWGSGALELEITRASADLDGAGNGSLVARFRVHAPDGANGSAFVALEIHQSKRFVGHYTTTKSGRFFVVWLRGARTYAWRANHQARLADGAAGDKEVGGNNYTVLDSVRPEVDFDRVKIHAPLDHHRVQGALTVDADLTYGGKLGKLETAETFRATIRVADLLFGHSGRRGDPGRALVDSKDALVVNFAGDWGMTRVESALSVTGNLSTVGAVRIGSDAARKDLDVSGGATIDQALTVGGAANLGGNLNVGTNAAPRALSVSGGLTVAGNTALGGTLSVGTDAARRDLSVSGRATIDQALTVSASTKITSDDAHLLLNRARSEAGGTKIYLELRQEDNADQAVPEVGTAIRFHHGSRYWHRLEANGDGLHVRDGNPGNNNYKPLYTGALTVAGALSVSAGASISGRANVVQLHITHQEFKVDGDRARFYPVVFTQDGWESGYYHFEITRSNVHLDGDWTGSLQARFEGHCNNWGHGSEWGRIHIRQYKQRFVAQKQHHPEGNQVIVWLRGNCTYRWRAWTGMSLLDFRATEKKYNNRTYGVVTKIETQLDQDTVYVGPEASGQIETDLKIIRGTVNAGGGREAGRGYTVTRDGNLWKVTYDIPFNGSVTVVATQQYPNDDNRSTSGNTKDNAIVVASTAAACWIKTGDGDGGHSWRRFHFIAMGQG